MIAQAQVMITLRPWLGMPLLDALTPLTEDLTIRLNGFSIRREEEDLSREMDSMLFNAVRQVTNASMLARLEDGTYVRIRLEDFAAMADELMLLAFNDFPVDAAHLAFLQDYSMRHPSLSALRALYERFAPLQSARELAAIASVARSCYPAFRWRCWLGE